MLAHEMARVDFGSSDAARIAEHVERLFDGGNGEFAFHCVALEHAAVRQAVEELKPGH